MRYELSVVVATADVLAPLHQRHRSARLVALDAAGLALVPVTDKLQLALDTAGHRCSPKTGFHRLSSRIGSNPRGLLVRWACRLP